MEFVQQPVPCKKKDRSGVGSESVAGLPGFDPDSNMLRAPAGSLVRVGLNRGRAAAGIERLESAAAQQLMFYPVGEFAGIIENTNNQTSIQVVNY